MKIYKHTFDYSKNIINTIEIEIEEKPKTYVVVERQQGVWESRINKDAIGVLERNWNRQMFTLTPERSQYLEAMIADIEHEMAGLNSRLEKANILKNTFMELLRKEEV